MARSFQEWLHEGEELYNGALAEYRNLEKQLEEIQQQLAAKRIEVNQIAQVIGQPILEEGAHVDQGDRSPTAPTDRSAPLPTNASNVDVVEPGTPNATPYTRNSIARALAGQPLRR